MRKATLLGAAGTCLLDLSLGACSYGTPQPRGQVVFLDCPSGYELIGRLCYQRPVVPPPSYAANNPPASPPAPHASTWVHDLETAGGGAAIGAVAGNQLAKRGAAAATGAAEEEGAGAAAATGAAEGEGAGAAVAIGTTGGEGAGAAAGLGEGAEGDAIITLIERGFIWVAEHPYVLLESYKSKSPEPWRDLVRLPGYAARTEQKT